ncbi:SIMPL domain-containing protein [uncultured Lacinutrix sp.]|uniref:SIMPL domain-containing protein n=1 Tax=uncultured Lacinutrix sp. TaxID=574032 RepID=UPI002625F54A|nr:SIMPL domain-containing protein [uncultured Lacinutrix sp.]
MKKLIFLMAVLFSVSAIAQENRNTITVVGETETSVEDNSYTILVSLQQILVYEGQGEVEVASVSEVKNNYINKLGDLGIDFSRFRRSTYYEFVSSYGQSRVTEYYFLKTSNKEEVRKIINLKLAGTSIANTEIESKKLTNDELVSLAKKAMDNAKNKAEALAKKMNKTVGDVVGIVDQNTSAQYAQSYGTNRLQSHTVTVSFELQ